MTPLRLPLLEPHRAALELCVYCPKLSRAACPVSNVEANETVTPWGKMSLAYFAARGDIPVDRVHAEPAWACSACYGCRERCDHKNEVATVLTDARAEAFAVGAAPAAAIDVAGRFPERARDLRRAVDDLAGKARAGSSADRERPSADRERSAADREGARAAVLIGCSYVQHAPEVAEDALSAVEAILGAPARPVRACCGLPLLYAGDRRGFVDAARALSAEVHAAETLVAVDPGCARTLLVEYPRAGVDVRAPEIFVDLAARSIDRLRTLDPEEIRADAVRYHDPCQLGRGLGRYDEPRAILAKITGRAPEGFLREREHGECSGGGGLLPVTRPETSRGIADARIAEHRERGGGALVTACAESLRRFRSRGIDAIDLVSLVARAQRDRASSP